MSFYPHILFENVYSIKDFSLHKSKKHVINNNIAINN